MNENNIIINYIDEMVRGRSRIQIVSNSFNDDGDPSGNKQSVFIAIANSKAPPTVPQIGRSLGLPRQNVQRQVDSLFSEGLIDFIANPDHKKAQRLITTSKGREIHQKLSARSVKWAKEFAKNFDAESLKITVETMAKIRKKIEEDTRQGKI